MQQLLWRTLIETIKKEKCLETEQMGFIEERVRTHGRLVELFDDTDWISLDRIYVGALENGSNLTIFMHYQVSLERKGMPFFKKPVLSWDELSNQASEIIPHVRSCEELKPTGIQLIFLAMQVPKIHGIKYGCYVETVTIRENVPSGHATPFYQNQPCTPQRFREYVRRVNTRTFKR